MPNYCYNTISLVSSKQEHLDTFYHANYDNENNRILSFNKLAPVSDIKSGIALNNMDCCEEWGTKWDALNVDIWRDYDPTISSSENKDLDKKYNMVYSFRTAWSPPTSWLHTVAEKFPEIDFELEYKEANCNLWGTQLYRDGIKIEEEIEPLGQHNWRICDRKKLDRIIDENMSLITKQNYTLRIETIVDDFSFEDGNWENIDDYVQTLVEQRLGIHDSDFISENVFIVKQPEVTSSL